MIGEMRSDVIIMIMNRMFLKICKRSWLVLLDFFHKLFPITIGRNSQLINVVLSFFITLSVGDPCNPNPCHNGGTCDADAQGSITCLCISGFKGDLCKDGNTKSCLLFKIDATCKLKNSTELPFDFPCRF